jgi:hypothetical protein
MQASAGSFCPYPDARYFRGGSEASVSPICLSSRCLRRPVSMCSEGVSFYYATVRAIMLMQYHKNFHLSVHPIWREHHDFS